jgi:hypothetical protein
VAFCSRCNAQMGQTEASCPRCGYDFSEGDPSRGERLKGWIWAGVFVVALGTGFHWWWPDFYVDITTRPYQSFMESVPPELPDAPQWLTGNPPSTLASLRGKTVWLEFSFLR